VRSCLHYPADNFGPLNEELEERKISGDEEVKEAMPELFKYQLNTFYLGICRTWA
jgi:hypothetical protein